MGATSLGQGRLGISSTPPDEELAAKENAMAAMKVEFFEIIIKNNL
jgi:hypothetical protein